MLLNGIRYTKYGIRKRRFLTLVEFLVALCIIFILLGVFAIYANITLRVAKETALQNELVNIRMSIEYYRVIRGKLPESLFILMNQKIAFEGLGGIIKKRGFLKPFRIDKEGNLIDPFRNRYYYNKGNGRAHSQTKGYENW